MDELMHALDLQIANLLDDGSRWTFRSSVGDRRRIDYVMYGPSLLCAASGPSDFWDMGSDHRAVFANLAIRCPSSYQALKARKGKSSKGWKPKLDDHNIARDYHETSDACLQCYDQPSATELSEVIATVARSSSVASKDKVSTCKPSKCPELKRLIRERRQCSDRVQRSN